MSDTSQTPTITLLPAKRTFDVIPGRSLLDAGLSTGLALPFGCANGSCGTCRARLVDGQVRKFKHQDFVLNEAEKLNGEFLLCTCTTDKPCTIEVLEANSAADIPQQTLSAKVCRMETINNVDIVAFKFVRGKALRFLPGQSVSVTFSDGFSIALPIASCPCNAQSLEFHLSAETCTDHQRSECLHRLRNNSSRVRIDVTGPFGTFTLEQREETGRPFIGSSISGRLFIAKGGEFGQLQGLIEQIFNLDTGEPCCLLWQETQQTDRYLHNLCRSWHDAIDEFDYVPVDSTSVILDKLPVEWQDQLGSVQVYLGSQQPDLINALVDRGVREDQIFYPV